ncbi:hypothetical protein ACRBEV_33000 (plasmid) [Methylobacterium phyllosphaerae]
MADLSLQIPLRVRHLNEECVVVEDATGTRAHYVYIDTDDTRRRSRSSVRPEQGLRIAQAAACALTFELERRGAAVTGDPANLLLAVDAATEGAGRA